MAAVGVSAGGDQVADRRDVGTKIAIRIRRRHTPRCLRREMNHDIGLDRRSPDITLSDSPATFNHNGGSVVDSAAEVTWRRG